MQRVDLVAKQRGLEVCTFLMGGWTRQGAQGAAMGPGAGDEGAGEHPWWYP